MIKVSDRLQFLARKRMILAHQLRPENAHHLVAEQAARFAEAAQDAKILEMRGPQLTSNAPVELPWYHGMAETVLVAVCLFFGALALVCYFIPVAVH